MASLTWLDYSDTERRKLLDVISAFRESGTVDELGVGQIRDAFADLLSPGTSTIQTRAKYFLLVPWIYQRLEAKGQVDGAAAAARTRELALIEMLVHSEDSDGTIGQRARSGLKRLPSNVYWTGLATWGIRQFPGSQDQYHRWLEIGGPKSAAANGVDDDEGGTASSTVTWHKGLPPAPEDFPKKVSLRLEAGEAEYLTERIIACVGGTLLEWLVTDSEPAERVAFPWEHPQFGQMPDHIREQLEHARCYSEVMHGSALLYNLMLAQRAGVDGAEEYEAWMAEWAGNVSARMPVLHAWERPRFWELAATKNSRIPLPAKLFSENWIQLVLQGDPAQLPQSDTARRLIKTREVSLKGASNARLANDRALERWGGASGTAQLSYRWGITQTYVKDILTARNGAVANA